ncbi:MAG: CbiX/SirB N-terminal domain-containing protein [Candidatus Thiodiazotropha sp.]
MNSPTILLADNGSRRPESVINLRRIAGMLSTECGRTVLPVSLQHADRIPAKALDGQPADTFAPLLERLLGQGEREFIVLPLFFGPSRALSSFIPEQVTRLSAQYGEFELSVAPVLCPLPEGESRLAGILEAQLPAQIQRIILVDHGSPIPSVTAVRRYLADSLRQRLGPSVTLHEAVMERRTGVQYDFNGELLEEVLLSEGERDSITPIALSMLFLSPGRHAGPGGDIETICEGIRHRYPNWPIHISGLVGDHPDLIPILKDRLDCMLLN